MERPEIVSVLPSSASTTDVSIPKHDRRILRSPPRVLPSSAGELDVHCATNSPIRTSLACRLPCVDHQARTGFEWIWLARREASVQRIQEGSRGDLCGALHRVCPALRHAGRSGVVRCPVGHFGAGMSFCACPSRAVCSCAFTRGSSGVSPRDWKALVVPGVRHGRSERPEACVR